MAVEIIHIGGAPLIWSEVHNALQVANSNFQFLESQLSLNTEDLDTDLIPDAASTRSLGEETTPWSDLFVDDVHAEAITADSIGTAAITIGAGTLTIDDGKLVFIDQFGDELPTQLTPAFANVAVTGQDTIVADFADTLTIEAGDNVTLTTSGNTLTISSETVTSIIDTADISQVVNPTTDEVSLFLVNPEKFDKVEVAGAGILTADNTTDTLRVDEGYGIVLSVNPLINELVISVDPEINIYGNVIGSDSTVIVDSLSGTLTGTLYGSVYADDSTVLVDAVSGTIPWAVIADTPLHVTQTALSGSAAWPVGTSAERDLTPVRGFVRFNTTINRFEGYDGGAWTPFETTATSQQEFTSSHPTPGTFVIDTFDGDVVQVFTYKIICKASGGVQYSTVEVLFDNNAFETEYGIILSQGNRIANFTTSVDVSNNVSLHAETLYANVDIVFRKTPISNL